MSQLAGLVIGLAVFVLPFGLVAAVAIWRGHEYETGADNDFPE